MQLKKALWMVAVLSLANIGLVCAEPMHILQPVTNHSVTIDDSFWSPKLKTWDAVMIKDVLDKFENDGAFRNFDRVAGLLDGKHEGPPWLDGLIYETIRGVSDFLVMYPDQELENRIDRYVERIARAQAVDPNGYVMTYTQLDEPGHQWGLNGGYLRWQHDVYNAGALVEAGIHHYRATGKVALLRVAVKLANHMAAVMGPSPRKNIVPAHPLPEEALVKLHLLFKEDSALTDKLGLPVDETSYLKLAEFWLENRGRNCGYPATHDWETNESQSQQWVRDQKYGSGRPCWGAYAQDDKPIFRQETLEGHAVRATLLCAGLTAAARVNSNTDYSATAARLWDNMAGKRLHLTGGVGAYAHEEKFGPDYALPNDAYLETCAAVGAGFFHRNMNLLYGDARYMDELERALYNNVINGVSLEGNRYYYQNPLYAQGNHRWNWHPCPCCPPMFLKMVSSLPGLIYARDEQGIYVNLFVGSQAQLTWNNTPVTVTQKTGYPWKGQVLITLEPQQELEFVLYVRVPGWARGQENPFGLYQSDLKSPVVLSLNGKTITSPVMDRGYALIKRVWKKGDTVTVDLPLQPRRISAHPQVKADQGLIALQSGPLVYCLEEQDNPAVDSCYLLPAGALSLENKSDMLGGVNLIKGQGFRLLSDGRSEAVTLTAIPFYCQDNRQNEGVIKVWLPAQKELAKPMSPPGLASQARISVSHCFISDIPGALNDGMEPASSNDHSIPRHTWWDHQGTTEWVQYEFNQPQKLSSVRVYWWDDRPAGGRCAIPQSWRLLYRTGNGQWQPLPGYLNYGVRKDQYNEAAFEAVYSDGLRLEATLLPGLSGGILEWKIN